MRSKATVSSWSSRRSRPHRTSLRASCPRLRASLPASVWTRRNFRRSPGSGRRSRKPPGLQLLDHVRHRGRRQVHPAGKLGGERVLLDGVQQEERLGRQPQGLQVGLRVVHDRLDQLPEVGQDAAGVRPALLPARRHGRPAGFRSQIVQQWKYTVGPASFPEGSAFPVVPEWVGNGRIERSQPAHPLAFAPGDPAADVLLAEVHVGQRQATPVQVDALLQVPVGHRARPPQRLVHLDRPGPARRVVVPQIAATRSST